MSGHRPVPLIDHDSAPFWEGLKDRKFLLMECVDCGHVFFPARVVCPECWSSNLDWRPATGSGVVFSFTVVEAGATEAFAARTPYTIALIALEEGCRVFGMLRDDAARPPAIGSAVRCDFETDPDSGLVFPIFELA